jgi:membrane protease YdiL (CAAX protease family)
MNTVQGNQPSLGQVFAEQGFAWRPDRDTLMAIGSYILVLAALFVAFQVFTTERVAANFLTFGPITLAGLGVALPTLYTVLVRRRPLTDLGLTTHQLLSSLVLGLLLGFDTYRATLGTLNVSWTKGLAPLITMALAVGLFEAIFFRGWLQLRFEQAFGMVPGLVLGALCYSLYHVGYGMTIVEILPLFGYGLVFAAVFRLTKNVVALWPFYTPVGGLYTNLRDGLTMPFEATYGFLLTLGLMLMILIFAASLRGRQGHITATARRLQDSAR